LITQHTGRAENPLVFKSVQLGCSSGLTQSKRGKRNTTESATRDRAQIFDKERGTGQPIVFSHGSPVLLILTRYAWTVHPITAR
jgi:hypothetical protein